MYSPYLLSNLYTSHTIHRANIISSKLTSPSFTVQYRGDLGHTGGVLGLSSLGLELMQPEVQGFEEVW